jgi:ATP-binding cassette subfamily A (ABC1) protein 3
MDLTARRQMWSKLREYKKDRIILLSTHYMDEADILGDRIGIMANGKLEALGSSMFLKRKFGVGYRLTIVKKTPELNKDLLPYFETRLGNQVKVVSEI